MEHFRFISHSEEETKGFAENLAEGLCRNDCLALVGDFGSGKTTFVKGLALGFGFRKKNYVCSPSFVILKIYPGRLPVYHFDLYRLNKERDAEDIGLPEFFSAGGVSVIEWAEKVRRLLPREHLKIEFSITGAHKRTIRFSTSSLKLKRLLRKIIP